MALLSSAILRSFLVSLIVLAGLLLCAELRAQSMDVPEGQTFTLSGEQLYDQVTIAGTLKIKPYDADEAGTG